MAANTFAIGDRVQLIPFQHKGKVATVKYFGAIGKKFGTWVGLELDEPTGDSSGDVGGEQLFECKELHGLVLRNTQVRLYDPNAPVIPKTSALAQLKQSEDNVDNQAKIIERSVVPQLNLPDEKNVQNAGLSGSPLLTPTQSFVNQNLTESTNKLLEKVNQTLANQEKKSFVDSSKTNEQKEGWQARLKRLQDKKNQEKQKNTESFVDSDALVAELRNEFAPTSGIIKDSNGNLVVEQNKVQKPVDGETLLKQIEEAKIQASKLQNQAETQDEPVTPTPTTKVEKKATPVVAETPSKPGHKRIESNADKIKAKQTQLEEERKARQGLAAKQGTATSRNQGSALANKSTLNQSINTDKKAIVSKDTKPGLNTTQKLASKDAATERSGLTRTNSSSRLGLASQSKTSSETSAPATGLQRQNSTSRLGLGDRPQTSTGARAGSNSRTTANIRGVARDGAQTARGNSKDKATTKELNSTLTSKVQTALNSTVRNNKTPVGQRPGAAEPKTTLASKLGSSLATKVDSKSSAYKTSTDSVKTPLDYKNIEALVREKTSEIQCLQEEVQGLNDRIKEITDQHSIEVAELTEKQKVQLKQLSDQHANEKIKFQTDIESITERLMHASPDGGQQSAEIMELAQLQLNTDREESNQKLKVEQEKYQSLIGELKELKAEQEEKNRLINELQEQVTQLQGQLKDQQVQFENEIRVLNDRLMENANETNGEQEKVHQDLIRSQNEIISKLQVQLSDQQKQNDFQRSQEVAQRDQLIKELQKKTMEQATAITELEIQRVEELELQQLELAQIKDEKEEILQQLLAHGKVEDEDPLQDIGLEEIKVQNKKLRTAITSLTFGFEEERKKLEAALKDETSKDRKIADLEEKIKEMDFLLEEVELKEQERADMQEKLEEIVEYENMVEEMVQEIAKKDEENEELVAEILKGQEEQRAMEDLNNMLEQYNKELTEQLDKKDSQIEEFKEEIEQLKFIVVEQDGLSEKYKERLVEMQNNIKVMGNQLQEYTQDGSKDQVGMLLEKQHNLIRQLREAESKQLQVQRNIVELWQGRTYSDLVQQILPAALHKEAQIESYKKVQQLNTLKHKATIFVREICEKQLDQAVQIYEEKEQLNSFISLMQRLGQLMNQIIGQCSLIQFQIANSSPEQYREITKIVFWDRLPIITSQVDTITDLMNNQSLSYTFETNDFAVELKQLEQLMIKVEKIFSALSPEEVKQQEAEGISQDKIMQLISYQRRKNLVEQVSKLKLRQASFNMALGVCFVSFYCKEQQGEGRQVSQKCKLIYLRLLDTIMKIDHIPNEDDGNDFIDTRQLNTELRLLQKLDSISVLWSGTETEIEEQRQKSWISVLEAIERDITMLNNDFKFKRLIKLVDQKYGSQKIDFNDLYKLDYQANGPWRTITTAIKDDLQDMSALKQKNTLLQEKQKEVMLQVITLSKQKEEALLISQQLDTKLSLALAKAEQVPALEIANKDSEKKVTQVQKQLQTSKSEVEKLQKSLNDLMKKIEEEKKAQALAPPPQQQQQPQAIATPTNGGSSRPNIRARPVKHGSRESRSKNYFNTLAMSGGFNKTNDPSSAHARNASQYNTGQMIQQLQMTEDVYMQIISELQYDRLKLKAKDMTQRIARLQTDGSSFSTLMKQFGQVEVRLNPDEQNVVQGAIKEVSKLRSGLKRQIAQTRVFDLTKSVNNQIGKAEQFNQQVLRAKEAVDETLELLFSKDTKFRVAEKTTFIVDTSSDQSKQQENVKVDQALIVN